MAAPSRPTIGTRTNVSMMADKDEIKPIFATSATLSDAFSNDINIDPIAAITAEMARILSAHAAST